MKNKCEFCILDNIDNINTCTLYGKQAFDICISKEYIPNKNNCDRYNIFLKRKRCKSIDLSNNKDGCAVIQIHHKDNSYSIKNIQKIDIEKDINATIIKFK